MSDNFRWLEFNCCASCDHARGQTIECMYCELDVPGPSEQCYWNTVCDRWVAEEVEDRK